MPDTTIQNAFQKMQASQESVRLLNIFKGVPVHCQAVVQQVNDAWVDLIVDAPESISLVWNPTLWMEIDDLPEVVTARVDLFDIVSGKLRLSQFEFGESVLGERMWVRVEPKNPVRVEIILHNQQINGSLADISTVGAGVYTYAGESAGALQTGSRVEIVARLPDGPVRFHGSVGSTTRSVDYHRISICFDANQPDETLVRSYIAKREEEIRTEIIRLYDTLVNSKIDDQQLPV
jgi:hypothetical protein